MSIQTTNRIRKLREKFEEKGIQAALISHPDNLFYLSGCEGLEGYLLITRQEAIMVTDFRYVEQAERQSPEYKIFRISGKMADWLPRLFSITNIQRLGFESDHLSYASYQQILEILKNTGLSLELIPVSNLVNLLRIIKEPEEVEFINQAIKITDAVYEHIEKVLRAGMTEMDLAWEIEKYMRENGSQPVPFELIVAAGPNAALPHAKPSTYVIHAGEPIVIDIGSKFSYYGSDLTRTLCIGKPDETFKKVYSTVLQAQQTAISRIKAGMTGAEADAVARKVIIQAGYGEAFGHSLGHGIGLITHEKPTLSPTSTDILANGMVFTIEPGIYLSGWGGVRIEDDVLMENDKLTVLSSARKIPEF
jgi:Xaa-Pro aminopeptidase